MTEDENKLVAERRAKLAAIRASAATHGVAFSFRALGVAFLLTTLALSQLIVNPEKPLNVAAPGSAAARSPSGTTGKSQ